MAQAIAAFLISAILFGGYAAVSSFLGGWKPDIWLLGFTIYGTIFGFSSFMTSMLAQIICKYCRAPMAFAIGISGVVFSALLSLSLSFFNHSEIGSLSSIIAMGLLLGLISLGSRLLYQRFSPKHASSI